MLNTTNQLLKQSERLIIFGTRTYSASAAATLKFKPTNETIATRLEKVSVKYPFYDALLFPNDVSNLKFNYKELWESVSGLASGFVESNINSNERVLTNASQTPEHVITQMAASTAGLTFVPVAPDSSLSQIGDALGTSSSKAFIVESKQKNRKIIDETIAYFPELERMNFKELFRDTRYPSLRYIISTGDSIEPGIDLYKEFVLQANLLKNRKTSADQISTLIPSSNGLVGYSQSSLINTGDALVELLGVKIHSRISFNVPFHSGTSYAFYMGALSKGAVMVVPSDAFSAEAALSSISKDKCTTLFATSEQISAILSSDKFAKTNLSCLTSVIVAGKVNAETASTLMSKVSTVKYVFSIDTVTSVPGQLSGAVFNVATGTGHLLPGIESKIVDNKVYTKGYHLNNSTKDWLETTISNVKINQDGSISKL